MALYSDRVMDHFHSPRNVGRLDPCDLRGTAGTPGRGPFMLFTANLRDGRVAEIAFQTYGCGPCIAAGSLMTELVRGRRLAETADIDQATLLAALGGLPQDKLHCVGFALAAWQDLLASAGRPPPRGEAGSGT